MPDAPAPEHPLCLYLLTLSSQKHLSKVPSLEATRSIAMNEILVVCFLGARVHPATPYGGGLTFASAETRAGSVARVIVP